MVATYLCCGLVGIQSLQYSCRSLLVLMSDGRKFYYGPSKKGTEKNQMTSKLLLR
jgi:hypothetical protein